MRFFNRAWIESEDDRFTKTVRDRYAEHIREISPQLPPDARQLAHLNLHDALFSYLCVDEGSPLVRMRLIIGDLQTGHAHLDIRYIGCKLPQPVVEQVRRLVEDPESEILYDEIDQAPTGFVHRLWCWPDTSLDIFFQDLSLTRKSVPSRERAGPPSFEIKSRVGG